MVLAIALLATGSCGNASDGGKAPSPVARVDLEPGQRRTLLVNLHCGYETLLVDVNDRVWSTATLGRDPAGSAHEPRWPTAQSAELELRLADEDTLEVTAPGSGVTHVYEPDPDFEPCA